MSKENPNTSRTPQLTTSVTQRLHGKPIVGSGSVSGSFFSAGDELESTSYKNVVVEDLSPPSLASEFSSFDKIPKRRAPLFAALSFLTLIVILLVNWRDIKWLQKQPILLNHANLVASTPASVPSKPASDPTSNLPVVVAKPTEVAPELAAPEEVLEAVPQPAIEAQIPALEDSRLVAKAPTRKTKAQPLRGYLWSPSANALVPAVGESAEFDSPTALQPEPSPVVPESIPEP